MKKKLLFLLFLFALLKVSAQVEDAWVYFKDKPNAAVFLDNPITMLTQRSLDRRSKQQISLDLKDVPLEDSYVLQIKNSSGIKIKARSKWLNALHIQGTQTDISNLLGLNFVLKVDFANKSLNASSKNRKINKSEHRNKWLDIKTDYNYGNALNQINMLGGVVLHQNNFTGQGMEIAIIDAGFPNVDTFNAFQKIRDNNQILGGYDFVNRSTNYYTGHSHGMSVLSTIASNLDGNIIGTAPDAKFYLFISEDSANETPLEESLWVEAAEKADSLGVDVINTSLGYTTFDNTNYNYAYADMDGKTTFISRGAEIAFSRGMIVVNAAGNEGNSSWHYISAPADANSVLSIGAVDPSGKIANFSSYGPTSDARIKPDVCAQGASVYIVNSQGNVATSNGTSFASPIMTGMVACLWEAFPLKTNIEIVNLIKESGALYNYPTDQEGYGIPNFENIYNQEKKSEGKLEELTAYPNPAKNSLNVAFPNLVESAEVSIYNLLGKKLYNNIIKKSNPSIDISAYPKGIYLVQFVNNKKISTLKILKN